MMGRVIYRKEAIESRETVESRCEIIDEEHPRALIEIFRFKEVELDGYSPLKPISIISRTGIE